MSAVSKVCFALIFSLSVTSLFAGWSKPDETRRPLLRIPKTISPEAQNVLTKTAPQSLEITNLEEWKVSRSQFNDFYREQNESARKNFIAATEDKVIAGIPVVIATPLGYQSANDNKIAVYFHGGGYTHGQPQTFYRVFAPIAFNAGLRVCAIDYALAPEHPFPAAIEQCVAVYKELLKSYAPNDIVFFGDSSGATLAVATILKARDSGLKMPAATALISPWSDITKTGESYYTLTGGAPVLHYENNLLPSVKAYVGDEDMKSPLISPVYADYSKGFPPTLITTGTRDLFLSNSVRLYRVMKRAGVDVQLDVWEGMWHVFQGFDIPEARESAEDIGSFLKANIGIKRFRYNHP